MESLIGLLGMLFFMFLVLSAAVEVFLEVFRGVLASFGVTWAKSTVTLDSALELAKEFAPDNTALNTKIEAVKRVAEQLGDKAQEEIARLEKLKENIKDAGADVDELAGELNSLAASVRSNLQHNDRLRAFIFRSIAMVIGCFLAWYSDFYVFRILTNAPEGAELFADLEGLKNPAVNIVVGGFAASAGSSYWHDQLSKIRNLKSATANLKALKI